ncbi:hypothetical protein QZH41_013056 [Actinostola sp. cb2023]|nr:hypothetical protein QZH41_013056 [Actinostola sp. cb2023]
MREHDSKQGAGCLPFKASMLFEPPVMRSRRRYLMKQRMKEWEGAKLLTLRMEASTLTESVSSPNIILGRRSSRHQRPLRFAAHIMSPVNAEDEDKNGNSIMSMFRSEGNLKKSTTLDRKDKPSRLAELEALEACYWLKAAGFPQYAQSYEEGRFPIDIAVVIKEHDFLDEDSLQSLFRRLQTLNHCAKLNLHIKRIDGYDSDEEDLITLSSRWKLQNKNRNWSRRKRLSSQLSGSECSTSTKISKLSAGQLAVLRKYSLLKVTALIERYTHSNRGMWNWSFPQFFKKFKTPDYRDKKVFGVPMSVVLQRSGQPLPKSILVAMNYLQRTGFNSVGIFRKSGGKTRIHNLKEMMESNQDLTDFEGMSPYDLADMLKEYFRDLPDPILTSKLAETFIAIYSDIPEELRIEALQSAVLLMPDENREALQTLLLFLNEVAANASENQMNEKNLGVCFAPSLFHLCGAKQDPSAPKRQKRTPINKASKELNDNLAAHQCLTQMITEVDRIFTVPEDTLTKSRFSFIEQGEPVTLDKLGRTKSSPSEDYNTYIESCINCLLKEAKDKFKGWVSHPWHESPVEISYKKIGDGCPLRLWRGVVEIEAMPQEVLKRITDERHLWDEDLETWDVVKKISNEVDVFHYVTQSMILQPKRSHVVLRARKSNLDNGECVLVCTSVSHPDAPLTQGVEATVLAQRYLIEPLDNGQSRLTYITRVDQRGRTPDYYKKTGPVSAAAVSKIKDSFPIGTDGPETKV